MLAWHLGLRYLRTRRAAWLAFAAITLTVAVPVVVVGVTQGFLEVTATQVRANESDITVQAPWFGDGLPDSPKARARLGAIPGITEVAPFVGMFGLMVPRGEQDKGVPVQIDGVDWESEVALGRLLPSMLHPQPVENLSSPPLRPEQRGTGFLTPAWRAHLALTGLDLSASLGLSMPLPPRSRPSAGVVVGREVLYGNGIRIGTPIQLVSGTGTKVPAEISDTLGTGILEIDRFALIAPLGHGQMLAGYGGNQRKVDGWRLRAAPDADLDALSDRVHQDTGLRATTWMERRGNMVNSLKLQRNIIGLVMILVQVITVFIVYAVFSTMVVEKRHDIGVLLGIGARRGEIAGAFLIAGIACCILGGVLGWVLGWGFLSAINPLSKHFGIPLFPQDVFYTPDAPTSYNALIPLFFIGVMTVVGLCAVAIPAWRASRIQPVEILREGG